MSKANKNREAMTAIKDLSASLFYKKLRGEDMTAGNQAAGNQLPDRKSVV